MSDTTALLKDVFAVLSPNMTLALEAVRPDLYPALDRDYENFHKHALIACHDFDGDWDSWERHPAGDELVMLVFGAATLVLFEGGDERSIELTEAGAFAVVPRGLWHTARVHEPTRMLFVTPGEGTEHTLAPTTS